MLEISARKLPPYNEEAEQYVLGACLLAPDAIARALETLDADDFYKTAHQKIYKAMTFLFSENKSTDLLSVSESLKKEGALDTIGGIEFLEYLEDLVPTSALVVHHAQIIREKKILRDLIEVATEIVTTSYDDSQGADDVLDEAEKKIFEIAERKSRHTFSRLDHIVKDNFDIIEKMMEQPGMVTGLETGFKDLDHLSAGFQPSDLIIIAGRPSMGKTSFALDIARFAATKRQKKIAIFSLEMSKEQLGLRLLCSAAKVSSTKLKTGFLADRDWDSLTEAGSSLSNALVFIDDSASLNALDIRARTRRLMKEHGLDMIIIDYLQLMQGRSKTENRQLEISEISRGLKALAKELDVPVVALSQLSRAVESRTDKRPLLSDLRESGSIEQDADIVMFIYRDEVYDDESADKGMAEILVRKHRNGPIGDVKLTFLKDYTRFENLSHEQVADFPA